MKKKEENVMKPAYGRYNLIGLTQLYSNEGIEIKSILGFCCCIPSNIYIYTSTHCQLSLRAEDIQKFMLKSPVTTSHEKY